MLQICKESWEPKGASRSYQEFALMLLEPNLKRQELTKWNNIIGLGLIRLLEQRDQWEEGPGNGEKLGALRTLNTGGLRTWE